MWSTPPDRSVFCTVMSGMRVQPAGAPVVGSAAASGVRANSAMLGVTCWPTYMSPPLGLLSKTIEVGLIRFPNVAIWVPPGENSLIWLRLSPLPSSSVT